MFAQSSKHSDQAKQPAWPLTSALAVIINMNIDINERKSHFEKFREERLPVLHEFSKNLGFANPHEILLKPGMFLEALSNWLSEQEISEDNKVWLATRVGYYIGEYFVVTYDGCWSVCETSSSRYYGRFVVGEFSAFNNPAALLDPIEAAMHFVNEPKGRSLSNLVSEITESLGAL